MSSLHDFSADTLAGKPLKLSRFKGKVVLVVNTASQCGLTPLYTGLENLHQRFRARGLAVIGFPCNQFGGQEPGGLTRSARFAAGITACRFR